MAPPNKRKKIKTGGMTLEEAKKKINDPNYNVMSGRIEKDKNVQTGPNKRRYDEYWYGCVTIFKNTKIFKSIT